MLLMNVFAKRFVTHTLGCREGERKKTETYARLNGCADEGTVQPYPYKLAGLAL
jgi:hypothetical protein